MINKIERIYKICIDSLFFFCFLFSYLTINKKQPYKKVVLILILMDYLFLYVTIDDYIGDYKKTTETFQSLF